MKKKLIVPVEALGVEAFAPYGWVLGKPFPTDPAVPAFSSTGSDFWHEHAFDPGVGGETEVLWVNYRNDSRHVRTLEVHWHTQQAIVPLGGGEIVHVICRAPDDGSRLPDLAQLRAFRVGSGQGLCMKPGCWHASFVVAGQTTCVMLTRRSTTADLVDHLKHGRPAAESAIVELGELFAGEVRLRL